MLSLKVGSSVPDGHPWLSPLQSACRHLWSGRCSDWSRRQSGRTRVHILVLPQSWTSLGKSLNSSAPWFLSSVKWGCSCQLHKVAAKVTHAAPGSANNELLPLLWPFSMKKHSQRSRKEAVTVPNALCVLHASKSHEVKKDFESCFVWTLFNHNIIFLSFLRHTHPQMTAQLGLNSQWPVTLGGHKDICGHLPGWPAWHEERIFTL